MRCHSPKRKRHEPIPISSEPLSPKRAAELLEMIRKLVR